MKAVTETSQADLSQMSVVGTKPAFARHLSRARKLLPALLGATALALVAGFATEYWTTGRFQVSTDDAYVAADSTAVAPKVSGYIKDVLVTDNQTVKAGDVLATIDNADFNTALDRAEADVAGAQADAANLRAQIEQQKQAIIAAKSTIVADQAAQAFARQEHRRFSDLVKTGYGTVQRVQQAEAGIRQATATVVRDQAALQSAMKQSDVLAAQLAKAEATVRRDQAIAQQAALNESYTTIVAPVDGTVGARAVRVGAYVQAGTQLMRIVPLHAVYVTANYKETQLTDVHPGQPVDVEVDTFPGVKIAGHVDSLSPASGQEFALLPPDNATGNFTKIVQRIPVKIAIDPNPGIEGKLRPGMSVVAEINTKPGAARHTGQLAAR
jgi:membrane fusion protein (multidrug efflux system)